MVLEILRILKDQVSADLNGVAVLRTMVEQWVQPLKLRACLVCDFTEVGDLSQESMEVLDTSKVMKRVAMLVTPATVVIVENVADAFSATYRPNLVSPPLPPYLLLIQDS
jgi:hypothetical protein